MKINDIAPNFTAETTKGTISLHEWIGNSWCVFVSHPKDFTPICTTELGLMALVESEFSLRGVKMIGHSMDSVEDHLRWIKDIEESQGMKPGFPIIADENLQVAKLYEMLPDDAIAGKRTIADNATVRAVFIIDPNKKIRAMTFYPMSAGRNFKEILRLVDSLQLSDKYKIATPVNWEPGQPVLIPPSVSNEEATKIFPQGWKTSNGRAEKPYLRYVDLNV